MSCDTNLACTDNARLSQLLNTPAANGIAAVEVNPHPFGSALFERDLTVYFYRDAAPTLAANLSAFTFTGGERIPGYSILVQSIAGSGMQLRLTLNQGGDFSDYTLHIADASLDPQFNCYSFSFKIDCPRLADCQSTPAPPAPPAADPPIDYLTKDYNSFIQALTDFLPTRVPTFNESSEADIAVTLTELFAYVGDQLSYYQDAVANEAWLPTCRQRLSAKRHARLVDYRMHDGLAARAVLLFNVTIPTTIPQGLGITTNDSNPADRIVFETDESMLCRPEFTSIDPWPWLATDCCLPLGASQADVAGDLTTLQAGDLLLVEEVLGPVSNADCTVSWIPEAADPAHRQIVRVASVTLLTDPLPAGGPRSVTRVAWQPEDALTWPACIVAGGQNVTLFRGNLVRASNGQTVANEPVDPVAFTLLQSPLTFVYNGG